MQTINILIHGYHPCAELKQHAKLQLRKYFQQFQMQSKLFSSPFINMPLPMPKPRADLFPCILPLQVATLATKDCEQKILCVN